MNTDNNRFPKDKVIQYIFIGIVLITFYWALNHLDILGGFINTVIGITMPFILGAAIAFVFNVPMRCIEKCLFKGRYFNKPKTLLIKRVLSYIITLIAFILVIALASAVVVPQLANTIVDILEKIPSAVNGLIDWATCQMATYPDIVSQLNSIEINWQGMAKSLASFIFNDGKGIITGGIGAVTNLFSAFTSAFIGFVFSIYILFQKERLAGQCRKILYAFLSEKHSEKVIRIIKLTDTTFSNFITGQCLEAVILGVMFFVVMTIFRMPYALLIAVSISVLALIPIVGAFIGCGLGVVLIAMVNPVQALIFLVMFLVLQQIEGNLIYPHVVGNSVGLPGIWVLVAVTIGGNLLGVVGILTFIPICSVLYALFREFINERLNQKNTK